MLICFVLGWLGLGCAVMCCGVGCRCIMCVVLCFVECCSCVLFRVSVGVIELCFGVVF